uniref:polynucleotide adenylyltransferase n=1 Tax=Meloidogyne incognita TaxID=6306 RepID=A0A914MZ76_MELIC
MLEKNIWEIFSDLMRVVKYWAKQKGLYSNVFGYLSGTALILMTTKICLIYQSASLTFLVQRFFQIYSLWWVLVYLRRPSLFRNYFYNL